MYTVTKEFSFEAAHSLPKLPETHKCHHLHGHSYKVVVHCTGDTMPYESWVVDYAEISRAVEPLIAQLDHKNLNDVLNIDTTAENLAFWFWIGLVDVLPKLSAIEIRETEKTNVIYRPEKCL